MIGASVRLPGGLDGKRDALAAADAKCDQAALEAVTPHRVNEPGREHGSGGADRMSMRDGSAFNVDDVLCKTELPRDRKRHRREGLVDLDALHVLKLPPG